MNESKEIYDFDDQIDKKMNYDMSAEKSILSDFPDDFDYNIENQKENI